MIKKDYLLRQLSTLLQAIVDKYTLVPTKDTQFENEVDEGFFEKYLLQKKLFFLNNNSEKILEHFNKIDPTQTQARLEILAELFYQEIVQTNNKKHLLKAIEIMELLIDNSKIFDFEKQHKLQYLKSL